MLYLVFPKNIVLMIFESQPLCIRWLQEMDRKQAEMVAAQIALEQLRQRFQLLKAENEKLKVLQIYIYIYFSLSFLIIVKS